MTEQQIRRSNLLNEIGSERLNIHRWEQRIKNHVSEISKTEIGSMPYTAEGISLDVDMLVRSAERLKVLAVNLHALEKANQKRHRSI